MPNPNTSPTSRSLAISGVRRCIADERFWLAVYVLVVGIATGICVARRCNNFLIFRGAFDHLRTGRDLYGRYPGEYDDLFK